MHGPPFPDAIFGLASEAAAYSLRFMHQKQATSWRHESWNGLILLRRTLTVVVTRVVTPQQSQVSVFLFWKWEMFSVLHISALSQHWRISAVSAHIDIPCQPVEIQEASTPC
jgi:hypothetical protein